MKKDIEIKDKEHEKALIKSKHEEQLMEIDQDLKKGGLTEKENDQETQENELVDVSKT